VPDITVAFEGQEISAKAFNSSPLQIIQKENKKLLKGAVCASVCACRFGVFRLFLLSIVLNSPSLVLTFLCSLFFQVDGNLWDLSRPLEKSCKLSVVDFESPEGKHVFWHSSAHVLGQALEIKFNGKLTVGPPLDEGGFYYDVFLGGTTYAVLVDSFFFCMFITVSLLWFFYFVLLC
jgi:hypothetical protein